MPSALKTAFHAGYVRMPNAAMAMTNASPKSRSTTSRAEYHGRTWLQEGLGATRLLGLTLLGRTRALSRSRGTGRLTPPRRARPFGLATVRQAQRVRVSIR